MEYGFSFQTNSYNISSIKRIGFRRKIYTSMQFGYIQAVNWCKKLKMTNILKMFGFKILIIPLIITLHSCEMRKINTVNVLVPRIEQLSGYSDEQTLSNKLAGKILENFAKKFSLSINYSFTNFTLHGILENEVNLKNTSIS